MVNKQIPLTHVEPLRIVSKKCPYHHQIGHASTMQGQNTFEYADVLISESHVIFLLVVCLACNRKDHPSTNKSGPTTSPLNSLISQFQPAHNLPIHLTYTKHRSWQRCPGTWWPPGPETHAFHLHLNISGQFLEVQSQANCLYSGAREVLHSFLTRACLQPHFWLFSVTKQLTEEDLRCQCLWLPLPLCCPNA